MNIKPAILASFMAAASGAQAAELLPEIDIHVAPHTGYVVAKALDKNQLPDVMPCEKFVGQVAQLLPMFSAFAKLAQQMDGDLDAFRKAMPAIRQIGSAVDGCKNARHKLSNKLEADVSLASVQVLEEIAGKPASVTPRVLP